MIAPAHALARIPDELVSEAAHPCCAPASPRSTPCAQRRPSGDLVAVLGIGGLGHLALQFASRMGFEMVAIARGKDKEELARTLGARRYLDNADGRRRRRARLARRRPRILATVTSAKAMSAVIDGLAVDGKLLVIGATPEPIEVSPFQLIGRRTSIQGWPSGVAANSEDTLVVQRAQRGAADGRDLSAGAGGGCL